MLAPPPPQRPCPEERSKKSPKRSATVCFVVRFVSVVIRLTIMPSRDPK